MEENRIKKAYEKMANENLSREERALKILNIYRNFYYQDLDSTEHGIIANAINEILPNYVNSKIK